jgi:hypothetical protein
MYHTDEAKDNETMRAGGAVSGSAQTANAPDPA